MRICALGDIHGRTNWKLVKEFTGIDKVIFLADYCDSYDKSNVEILHNLNEIIEYKKEFPDKVELLTGNHDVQYMFPPNFRCSGFRPEMLMFLNQVFRENRELFNIAYQKDKYIFSHAGITNSWLNWCGGSGSPLEKHGLKTDLSNLAEVLNKIMHTSNNWALHMVGEKRGGLRGDFGGPTWADRSETKIDALNGFTQIVGHTPCDSIMKYDCDYVGVKPNTTMYYCDCLGKDNATEKDFLILDI